MVDRNEKADKEAVPTNSAQKARVRSSLFRYYIHDSIAECRLQLLGELTEADLSELNGCWRTARTTLGNRPLILDVERLKSVDEGGKQWLIAMGSEGAAYRPDSYLRTGLAGYRGENETVKSGFFGRVLSFFRGSRALPAAGSPTQAQ